MRPVPGLTSVATDIGRPYQLTDRPSLASVRGPAPDLVLLLHRRLELDQVDVEGDRSVVEAFLIPIG